MLSIRRSVLSLAKAKRERGNVRIKSVLGAVIILTPLYIFASSSIGHASSLDQPFKIDCDRLIQAIEPDGDGKRAIIDRDWGIVRLTNGQSFCREPIEVWESRNLLWSTELQSGSEAPNALLGMAKRLSPKSNSADKTVSVSKEELARPKIVLEERIVSKAEAIDASTLDRVGAATTTLSTPPKAPVRTDKLINPNEIILSAEEAEFLKQYTPPILDAEVADSFLPKPPNLIIQIRDGASSHLHRSNLMKLYSALMLSGLIILLFIGFRHAQMIKKPEVEE